MNQERPSTHRPVAVYAGLAESFVMPFYLDMMRLNALHVSEEVLSGIGRAATILSADDVIHLLRMPWREQVMGAWYSLAHLGDATVREVVLDCLANRCSTDLSAAPLATAAVMHAGRDAVPALSAFVAADPGHDRGEGGRGVCAAAAEYVLDGEPNPLPPPTEEDRAKIAGMLKTAVRIVVPR